MSKSFGRERHEVTDRARRKGFDVETMLQTVQGGKGALVRDVMLQSMQGGKWSFLERHGVTDSARGKGSFGRDLMLQTVKGGEKGRSRET